MSRMKTYWEAVAEELHGTVNAQTLEESREEAGRRLASSNSFLNQKCLQCGKVLGAEVILGSVCGRCCRKNHRRVAGR